jgi:hypothetical protein
MYGVWRASLLPRHFPKPKEQECNAVIPWKRAWVELHAETYRSYDYHLSVRRPHSLVRVKNFNLAITAERSVAAVAQVLLLGMRQV